ncbi:MAG: metal ABC transporter solute-binding protein, Zn/Mn family [Desulfopila sp.]
MKKILVLVLSGMLLSTTTYAADQIDVFVSIAPIKWLVDKVGQERVRTHILVAEGQEPHRFEPTPRQIATMSKSEIWFTSGLEFEKQLHAKVANLSTSLEIIDIADTIDKLPMSAAGHHHEDTAHAAAHHSSDATAAKEHHHDAGHEEEQDHGDDNIHGDTENHHADKEHSSARQHDQGDDDPHVWLSPRNLKIMADRIVLALADADGASGDFFQNNAEALHDKLNAAHTRIAATLKPYAGSSFYVYHPSFGYFADAYGLEQRAVEIEGKTPTPKQLKQLITRAKEQNMRVIFVQPQFDPKGATAVARAIGGNVVPLDPLHGEVLENLMKMAEKISSALDNT